jgi:simple sugar transport system ATP-binding protein
VPSTLRLENVSKSFEANQVLKAVDLAVDAGEIHGLVGENGSGKTTLLNILLGHPVIRQTGGYSGRVLLDGQPLGIRSPGEAIAAGLGMVHQEFALLPGLTVAENITFGREKACAAAERMLGRSLSLIDRAADRAEAAASLRRLGLTLNPDIKAGSLSVNLMQYVEIAREIGRQPLRVLIVDEPTATMGDEDSARLLPVLQELAGRGTAVIFVSHRLEEVLAMCHRITVLRDGEVVDRLNRGEQGFSLERVARAMVGREIVETKRTARSIPGRALVSFEDFGVEMPGESIRNLNLEIRQGEILGIAGLSGHGKLAIGCGLMGWHPTSGVVRIDGRELNTESPRAAIGQDIFLLPDDRRQSGLLLGRSIVENAVFASVQQKSRFLRFSLGPLSLVDWRAAEEFTRSGIDRLDIHCRGPHQQVRFLSGGNQQKVCLIRAMAMEPRLLAVAEPTRGVDVGARQAVLEALLRMNQEQGTTIICASSELRDLKQICDRIMVVYEGRAFGEISPGSDDLEFALALSGRRKGEHGRD